MKVNFTDAAIPDFSPIPTGTYHFVVTDADVREAGQDAKTPGAEYISWELTVQDGEYQGRKCWTNTMCEGNGVGFLKAMLWAAGVIEKDAVGDLDFDPNDVIGKHIQAKVTIDTKRDSNNVKSYRPYEGASTGDALAPA